MKGPGSEAIILMRPARVLRRRASHGNARPTREKHLRARSPNFASGRSATPLLNPSASYFDHTDLLISADCIPFAYGDFHTDFLKDKIVIMFCPKLDKDLDGYITKLAEIFTLHAIKTITVARMEVPCCGGVRFVVDKALEKSGKDIPVTEKTISIQGKIL